MGRSAAINLAPVTGAAIAITKTLPEYAGKFDGIAVRTPVPVGSISDITFIVAEILLGGNKFHSRRRNPNKKYQLTRKSPANLLVSTDIIKSPCRSC